MCGRAKRLGIRIRKRRALKPEQNLSARNGADAAKNTTWFSGKTHVWVVVLTLGAMASGALLLALAGWFVLAAGMAGLGLYLLMDMHTPSGGVRALALIRVGLRYAEQLYAHRVLLEQIAFLRERLFAGLASRRLSELYRLDHQQQFAALLLELRWLEQHLPRLFWPSAALVVLLLILSVVWWWYAPLNAALLLLLAMLFLILGGFSAYLGRTGGQAQESSQAGFQRLDAQLVQGLSALNGFGGLNRQHAQRQQWRRELEQIQQRRDILIAFVQINWTIVSLAVLMLGAVLLIHSADVPVVAFWVLMVLGVYQMAGLILPAFLDLSRIRKARRYWQKSVQTEKNTAAKTNDHNGLLPDANAAKPALFAREVRLVLPDRAAPVLDSQTLTLQRGALVLLDGPSGAGKSLLLATLAGLIRPDSGEVFVQKMPVLALDNAQHRRLIGYLPQENEMLADSIAENLRIADPSASDDRLWTVLTQVGLTQQIQLRDGGLYSDVGDAGTRLSGGQKRRLGWARLLLTDPDILLLDEPFNGLDAASRQQLIENLKTWLADKAVLIVAHGAGEAWAADYCFQLVDGKITPRCCIGATDGDTVESHKIVRE